MALCPLIETLNGIGVEVNNKRVLILGTSTFSCVSLLATGRGRGTQSIST